MPINILHPASAQNTERELHDRAIVNDRRPRSRKSGDEWQSGPLRTSPMPRFCPACRRVRWHARNVSREMALLLQSTSVLGCVCVGYFFGIKAAPTIGLLGAMAMFCVVWHLLLPWLADRFPWHCRACQVTDPLESRTWRLDE